MAADVGLPVAVSAGAQSRPTDSSTVAGRRPVVVASKPFGESYLLCEMFAQLLESRGMSVERRPGLGATEIAFGALRSGASMCIRNTPGPDWSRFSMIRCRIR